MCGNLGILTSKTRKMVAVTLHLWILEFLSSSFILWGVFFQFLLLSVNYPLNLLALVSLYPLIYVDTPNGGGRTL